MGQAVVHFEILAEDPAKIRSFYTDLFGWQIQAEDESGYGIVHPEKFQFADGSGIGGGIGSAPQGYPGHVTFYVEVPDVEAALDMAETLGGVRLFGPQEYFGFETGMFRDPEGHVVGVVTPAERS